MITNIFRCIDRLFATLASSISRGSAIEKCHLRRRHHARSGGPRAPHPHCPGGPGGRPRPGCGGQDRRSRSRHRTRATLTMRETCCRCPHATTPQKERMTDGNRLHGLK